MIFASTSALKGIEQSQKDDLEAIFNVLVYLKNGSLPWMKYMNANKQECLTKILNMHKSIKPEELLKGFPKQVIFVYKSIKNLTIFDIPDYDIYTQILEIAKNEKKEKTNNIGKLGFDWEIEIEKIYKKYLNLEVEREELLKISFLKKGYQLDLEEFMKLFI